MRTIWQDLRYGVRMLRKNTGFTALAVLTLALGIGANTVIFSVMNATILKRLSFPDSDRLVLVWETFGQDPNDFNIVSAPNFQDFQRQNNVFEKMALLDSVGRGYNLASGGNGSEPEQVPGLRVSVDYFSVLGVRPLLGRTFLPEEEARGNDHEVILSYGLWKRRYGGSPDLVGKTIRVDGDNFTVVGVMPREFHWEFWSGARQLWVPVAYTESDKDRTSNSFISIARLKPGVTVAQANAQIAQIASGLVTAYPKENATMGAKVQPMAEFGMEVVRRVMLALLTAVGFVLLIACVNLANLLLARGAGRQKELAVRRALGASGARIARQLLVESVLLSMMGGLASLLLVTWCIKLLPSMLPVDSLQLPMRQLEAIAVDGRVLAFTLVISFATGILFGLIPALASRRSEVTTSLKDGERGSSTGRSSRLRNMLVASEVALALVVLCGAGLMIQSMSRLLGVDPGFNPHNTLTMEMSLPQEDLYNGPPGLPRYCQNLDESIGTIPGVVAVGAVAHLPMQGDAGRSFAIEGRPDPGPGNSAASNYSVACPNYFKTMGVPVIEGREFTHQDILGGPGVVVINQAMARKFWPNEGALGKRIKQGGTWLTIVGIVADVHHWGLDNEFRPQMFRPYTQAAWPVMSVVVRTTGAPLSYETAAKKSLAVVLPDRPVSGVSTLEELVKGSLGSRRFPMMLLAAFAMLALALAAVGIVGVVSYSVAQRTHEIGIRMALGAGPASVLRMILQNSMTWVLVGIAAGACGSLALTRLLGSLLFDVQPGKPVVLVSVSGLLAAVALLASYLPARRATKVDPLVALRYE